MKYDPFHISFATPDQGDDIQKIEKLMRKTLPVVSDPEFSEELYRSSRPKELRPGFRSGGFDPTRRFKQRRRR